MFIIEACPMCGHDLVIEELLSYPPIVTKRCPFCGFYEEYPKRIIRIEYQPRELNYAFPNVPKACTYCSNNPNNGGSGICNCTLGSQITF